MRDFCDISKKSPFVTCHLGNLILLTFFAQVILVITIAVCSYPIHAKELPESQRQVGVQPNHLSSFSASEEVSSSNGDSEVSRENVRMDSYKRVSVDGQEMPAAHAEEPRHASSMISQLQLPPLLNKNGSGDGGRSASSYRGNTLGSHLERVPQPQRQRQQYSQPSLNKLKEVSSNPQVPQQQNPHQLHGNTPQRQQQQSITPVRNSSPYSNNQPQNALQPAPPESPPHQQTYVYETQAIPPSNNQYSRNPPSNEAAHRLVRFPPQLPLERPYFHRDRPSGDPRIPTDNENNPNPGRVMVANGFPMEFRYAHAPLTPSPTLPQERNNEEDSLWKPVFMYYQPLRTEESTHGYKRPEDTQGHLRTDDRYQQSYETLQGARQYEPKAPPASPARNQYTGEERRPEQFGSPNHRYPGGIETDSVREVQERSPVYGKGTQSELNPIPRPSYDGREPLIPSQPPYSLSNQPQPLHKRPYNPEIPPIRKAHPVPPPPPKESLLLPLEHPGESPDSPPRRGVTTYEDNFSQRYSVPPQESQQPQRHFEKNPLRRAYEEQMTPIRRRTFFQYAPRLTTRLKRMSAFQPNQNY